MVWCNYEYAWGGRYQSYYKEQSLNGCAILEHELQPIRFQGQFFDTETSLHYNRFRYYDSDVGMFIQRDPIGLLGGVNVYQYADNPVQFIDPFGLATLWGKGKEHYRFNKWFDTASLADVQNAMSNPITRAEIKDALRGTGKKHEWFPVSMAAKAKELGFTAKELKALSTPTKNVYFTNIPDPKNPSNLLEGQHPTKGNYNNSASSTAHKILMNKLKNAKTKDEVRNIIDNFAKNHTKRGCI